MFSRIESIAIAGGLAIGMVVANVCARASADGDRASAESAVLRVLIITGRGDHDWRATVPFLRRILADTGRFDVRVCEAPIDLTSRALASFDVVVDDCGASAPAMRIAK